VLGWEVGGIAAEKAGILKPGVPVVTGERLDPRASSVIGRIADERGCPRLLAARVEAASDAGALVARVADTPWGALALEAPHLRGRYQARNPALALAPP